MQRVENPRNRATHRFAQAVLNLPFPFDDSVKAPRLSQECSSRGNGGDTDVAKESSSTNISPISLIIIFLFLS